jgi:hypothetical protein
METLNLQECDGAGRADLSTAAATAGELVDPADFMLSLSQHEIWLDQRTWAGSAHLNIGGGAFLRGRSTRRASRRRWPAGGRERSAAAGAAWATATSAC